MKLIPSIKQKHNVSHLFLSSSKLVRICILNNLKKKEKEKKKGWREQNKMCKILSRELLCWVKQNTSENTKRRQSSSDGKGTLMSFLLEDSEGTVVI